MKAIEVTCPDCNRKYGMPKRKYDLMVKDEGEIGKNWIRWNCPDNNKHFEIKLMQRVNAIPHEKRQEILDLLWAGLSIGEIKEKLNLETHVVAKIIVMNIESAHYLRRESI